MQWRLNELCWGSRYRVSALPNTATRAHACLGVAVASHWACHWCANVQSKWHEIWQRALRRNAWWLIAPLFGTCSLYQTNEQLQRTTRGRGRSWCFGSREQAGRRRLEQPRDFEGRVECRRSHRYCAVVGSKVAPCGYYPPKKNSLPQGQAAGWSQGEILKCLSKGRGCCAQVVTSLRRSALTLWSCLNCGAKPFESDASFRCHQREHERERRWSCLEENLQVAQNRQDLDDVAKSFAGFSPWDQGWKASSCTVG